VDDKLAADIAKRAKEAGCNTAMLEFMGADHHMLHRDLKFANNPRNFWVVEIADGILQRETAMLLQAPDVRQRIHKLIFCAQDALGAVGSLHILRDRFGLVPDAISGVCTSSPLSIAELEAECGVPVFRNMDPDLKALSQVLL
jgi:hypothetical protein